MHKAYKFRIKPSKDQIEILNKTFGCNRFVYNYFLNLKKDAYEATKESISYNQCAKILTSIKSDFLWLKKVDSISLQQSLKDLDKAFKNFFRGSGYAKFKKKTYTQSYRTELVNNNIKVEGSYIKLPKLGLVKFIKHRNIQGKILNATVSRTNTGKYFVSICTDAEIKTMPELVTSIGIDVGIKSFATLSTGEDIGNPKYLKKYLNNIKELQKELSLKTKGSLNYHKIRLKLAKLHEKVANCRYDFLHKLSTALIRNNQTISVEGLKIKSMLKNNDLAQSISDVSWSMFFNMLEYKANWYGRIFNKVDTFFPSSQLCSVCGAQNYDVKDLSIRYWTCSKCNTIHNRDVNASININNEGLRLSLT